MAKDEHVEKGPGLARGPALITGAILAAAGLILFLKAGDTPTGTFPDGTQNGPAFLGFETNGWTAWFTIAAGALLLFGAAQHLLAKTMSLVVGLALGACSVIALVDGDDVLGLAAANGPVKLAWGIAAAVLLFNTLMPRIRHKTEAEPVARSERRVQAEPVAAPRPPEPVAPPRRTERVETHPVESTPVPGTQRVISDPRDDRDRLGDRDVDIDRRAGDTLADRDIRTDRPSSSGGSVDPDRDR